VRARGLDYSNSLGPLDLPQESMLSAHWLENLFVRHQADELGKLDLIEGCKSCALVIQ
jgi:hypothetical protein